MSSSEESWFLSGAIFWSRRGSCPHRLPTRIGQSARRRIRFWPESHPWPGAPVTITVYGGEVQLDGENVRATDHNRAPIVKGQDYLLFLRTSSLQGPGLYEIYYAGVFEVAGNSLKPLLRIGNEVFEESKNATLPEVVDRVQKAKRR